MKENYTLCKAFSVVLFALIIQGCDVKDERGRQGDEVESGEFLALDVVVKDENFADCVSTQATASGWSQSIEVTSLNCDNSEIASIDGIEEFEALSSLSLRNNLLSEVDLSELNLLKTLDLGQNRIQSLDLDNNALLTELRVDANLIRELDISAQATLIKLDVSANPALGSIQFPVSTILEALIADELVAYDFQSLELALHPRLTVLSLNNNFLDELDIAGTPLLSELYVSGNLLELNDLDFLSTNDYIQLVDLSNNFIISDDVDTLSLESGIDLSSLNLSGNFISDIDLTNCGYITELDLSDNSLSELDFSSCSFLKSLNVSNNNLTGDIDISVNTNLITLDASSNFLNTFGDYRLTHQNLESVNLLDNNLESHVEGPTRSNLILLQAEGVEVSYE